MSGRIHPMTIEWLASAEGQTTIEALRGTDPMQARRQFPGLRVEQVTRAGAARLEQQRGAVHTTLRQRQAHALDFVRVAHFLQATP